MPKLNLTRSKLPPLGHIKSIEAAIRKLATGDLHGWASKEDLEVLSSLEIKLRALRHRLESRVERAAPYAELTTRRQKP